MFAIMSILNILCVVILMLVILMFSCNEAMDTEVQEVKLLNPEYWPPKYHSGKQFTVLENKPLNIVFEAFYATYVVCKRPDNTKNNVCLVCNNQTGMLDNYENGTSVYKVPNVNVHMNCKWSFQVGKNYDQKMDYIFEIRVKGARKVRVNIDGIERLFTASNTLQAEYDGVYEHPYEEGNTMDLTCSNSDLQGKTRLKYYNALGTEVLGTDEVNETLSFRQLMRPENNGSYVDCTYSIKEETEYVDFQEFTYRTIFTAKNERWHSGFIVTINDTRLSPSQMYSKDGIYKYQYKFINGEPLTVTCEKKNKETEGAIIIAIAHKHNLDNNNYLKDIDESSWKHSILIDTENLLKVRCLTRENNMSADIEFHEDRSHKTVILGLPASGILYQYSKNEDEWVAHYQYSVNETLNLACMTEEYRTLQWNSGRIRPKVDNRAGVGSRYIYATIVLNYSDNNTDISCEATKTGFRDQKYAIKLHLKPDLSASDNSHEIQSPYLSDEGSLIWIGGGLCGVLVAIAAVWAYCWCTRVRNTGTRERPFESFNENDNPIPSFPNQWNDNEYTYIKNEYNYIKNDDGVMMENQTYCGGKQEYAVPQKKITTYSNQTENHYTEIDDIMNRNDERKPQQSLPYENHVIEKVPSIGNMTYSNIQKNNKNLQKDNLTNPSYHNLLIGACTRDRNKNSDLRGELYSNLHCM